MIARSEITSIGTFLKPHGIKGEIAAQLDIDLDYIDELSCIVCEMDGIPVPFFINSFRSKGSDTALLCIDGVSDESDAAQFSGKTIYALSSEVVDEEHEDGMYLTDMAGFSIFDQNGDCIGTITDIDDSTANILFIVETKTGTTVYVPAAEDLITKLDLEARSITMELPEGLLDN